MELFGRGGLMARLKPAQNGAAARLAFQSFSVGSANVKRA